MRLGSVAGIEPGTHGTYFLDAFESRRLTHVGRESVVSVAEADEVYAWSDHDESEPEEAALRAEVLAYAAQQQSPQLFLPWLAD